MALGGALSAPPEAPIHCLHNAYARGVLFEITGSDPVGIGAAGADKAVIGKRAYNDQLAAGRRAGRVLRERGENPTVPHPAPADRS